MYDPGSLTEIMRSLLWWNCWLIKVQKGVFAFLVGTKEHESSQCDPSNSRDEAWEKPEEIINMYLNTHN